MPVGVLHRLGIWIVVRVGHFLVDDLADCVAHPLAVGPWDDFGAHDRFAGLRIGVDTRLQEVVVDVAAATKVAGKEALLLLRGIEPELVGEPAPFLFFALPGIPSPLPV